MFKYRNEAAFSKAVVAHLRKQGWFVQRIETGSTGRGVPDIYAVSPVGIPFWLELKREHKSALRCSEVQIHWRPGQQAWLYAVAKTYKQLCYTLAAFDDCILVISHSEGRYIEDMVRVKNVKILPSISAL